MLLLQTAALSAGRTVNPFGQKPNRNAAFLRCATQSRHDFAAPLRLLCSPSTLPSLSRRAFREIPTHVAHEFVRIARNDSHSSKDIRVTRHEGLAKTRMLPSSCAHGRARTGGESRTTRGRAGRRTCLHRWVARHLSVDSAFRIVARDDAAGADGALACGDRRRRP